MRTDCARQLDQSANHLILVRDLGLIDDTTFTSLNSKLDEVGKMLTGLEAAARPRRSPLLILTANSVWLSLTTID